MTDTPTDSRCADWITRDGFDPMTLHVNHGRVGADQQDIDRDAGDDEPSRGNLRPLASAPGRQGICSSPVPVGGCGLEDGHGRNFAPETN
jgi:hypothetical protein